MPSAEDRGYESFLTATYEVSNFVAGEMRYQFRNEKFSHLSYFSQTSHHVRLLNGRTQPR